MSACLSHSNLAWVQRICGAVTTKWKVNRGSIWCYEDMPNRLEFGLVIGTRVSVT